MPRGLRPEALNAFSPHGTFDGATIGENADTLR